MIAPVKISRVFIVEDFKYCPNLRINGIITTARAPNPTKAPADGALLTFFFLVSLLFGASLLFLSFYLCATTTEHIYSSLVLRGFFPQFPVTEQLFSATSGIFAEHVSFPL